MVLPCVSLVIALLLLHVFIGRPVIKYMNRLKTEFKSRQAILRNSEELIRDTPDPIKALGEIGKKFKEFKEIGLTRRQLPRLIQLLGKSFTDKNIYVVSIKPRGDIKSDSENLPVGVTKVYIEMVISCPYQALGAYMKTLSELPIAFTVETISVEKKEDTPENKEAKAGTEPSGVKPRDLIATMVLSTYMVLEI